MDSLSKATKFAQTIINIIGQQTAWLSFLLVILICSDVSLRYIFSTSPNWLLDLEWHCFSIIFLLGSAYALREEKHVRVDVFYIGFTHKTKAIIDLLGHVFLLLPWCAVIIYTAYNYTLNSWYMNEGSPDPGGLPFRYLIKGMIVLGFVLLGLQALILIHHKIKLLLK